MEIAKIWRAKFRKMRRLGGGRRFWVRRKVNRIYSQHTGRLESYERVVYGVLLMVIIESSTGKVVDIWFHPASYNEGKSLRIRFFKSPYLRELLNGKTLIADRGFDGFKLPGVNVITVGRGKGKASQRQYVESVFSVVGRVLQLPWKLGITAQAYIHAASIAFNRRTRALALHEHAG